MTRAGVGSDRAVVGAGGGVVLDVPPPVPLRFAGPMLERVIPPPPVVEAVTTTRPVGFAAA